MDDLIRDPKNGVVDSEILLDGRFRLRQVVGQGEGLTVYHATDEQRGTNVLVTVRSGPIPADAPGRWDVWHEMLKLSGALVPPAVAASISSEHSRPENWRRLRPDRWKRIRTTDMMPYPLVLDGDLAYVAWYMWVSLSRRGRRDRQPGNFAKPVRRMLLEAAGCRCERCGAADGLEVDHIIPIVLGGSAGVENGQVLCAECHRVKTSIEDEFSISYMLPSGKTATVFQHRTRLKSTVTGAYLHHLVSRFGVPSLPRLREQSRNDHDPHGCCAVRYDDRPCRAKAAREIAGLRFCRFHLPRGWSTTFGPFQTYEEARDFLVGQVAQCMIQNPS